MKAFLDRPIEADWPYLWIDATYIKVRQNGRIVSVAVIVAVGANADGRREVLGMQVGPSEAETFWTDFLRGLARRGLRGVKLVISDAHEGIKAAVAKVMHATWQRCRVHFMRNVSAHAGKSARRVVTAFMSAAFAQDTADAAKGQWRKVADQVRPSLPKLAGLLDEAETDVLAYMTFPPAHRAKLHSTNPLERLNGEIKRRTEVVGIFPNELAVVRGWSEPLMMIAPIGHLLAERDRVSLAELQDQTLALPTADECPGYLAQIESLLSRHQVRPAQRMNVRHWNTAVSFAATGRAIALCPTTMVHTSNAVAIVPIAEEDAELTTWLLYREGELSPAVSLVLNVASELAEDVPLEAEATG